MPVISVSNSRQRRLKLPFKWLKSKRVGRSRWPLALALIFLLTVIPFVLLRGSRAPQAEASWWNSSWQYRQRVDVANSNATDLTDFQVSFTLDTASLINAGKLQSECQDIRVTDIGGKELPHWIEENNPGCNSATTKVWVKMPSLSRSGGTLYAYYGNASAPVSPNHDGNKVFEFFDDFESYELGPLPTNSKWGSRSGSWVIIDSRFAAGSKSLTVSGVTGNDSMYWLLSNYQNTTGILEGLVYSNSNLSSGGDAFRQSLCVAIRDDLSRGICLMRGAVSHSFRFLHSNVAWGPPGYNYSFAENAWYNFQLMLQTDFVKGKAWELEQPEPLSPQLDWSYSTRSGNYFGLASRTDINGFDNIHVRKVATSEPIATPAAEETVPGPIAYWKFDEGSGQIAHDSAGYSPGQEVLNDGDMEAPDIDAWTAAYSTISKESDTPYGGSNYLRITPTSGYPAARQQVLKVGQSYRFKGWVRIQAGQEWRVRCTTTNIITGIGSGDWEYVDVHFVATTDTLGLSGVNASVPVEWDDVSVIETASGNHGTITGATWASEDQCVSGKCLSFDGNDYVSVGSDPSLDVDTMSVSVWVYPTLSTGWYTIFQRADGAPNGYRLKISNTQKWAFSGGLSGTFAQSSQNVQANTWTHIVGTYDGIVNKIYVNGQLAASFEESGTLPSTAGEVAMIGSYGAGTSQNFPGLLDEVKIFPYALTEDEIKAEYNLGAAAVIGTGPAAPPPEGGNLNDSLVAHWAFDEQAGQTVHDRVSGNHGTLGADANAGTDDPTWKPVGECKVNGCLEFDGAENYANTPDINAGRNSTLTGWFRLGGSNSARYLFGGSGGFQRIGVFNGNSQLGFYPGAEEGGGSYLYGTSSLNDNEWHHVAFVDQGSPRTRTMYIDGVVEIDNAPLVITDSSYGGDNILTRISGNYGVFAGLIDEVKIYNTALTPEQVLQDMNAGSSLAVGVGADEADEIIDGAGAPPIAEWKFDEKQGTTAYDTSGNGNDGTVNGATWKSGCKQGACLEFDGVDDRVQKPSFLLPETHTIEMWVNPQEIARAKSPLSFGGAHYVFEWASNKFELQTYDDGYKGCVGTSIVPENSWTYLTISYESSSKTKKIYVNGTLENSCIQGSDFAGTNNTLTLGTTEYSGQIDHVKIYDYARTPAQIAYDYNRGAPVAHWKFDECEGTVAHDSSGNDNHGTIIIGPSGSQSTAGTCQTSGAWANGASGKFNGSLGFDGSDDVITVPHPAGGELDFGNSISFSIAAWVKTADTSGTYHSILEKGGYGITSRFTLFTYGDGKVRVYLADGSTNQNIQSNSEINDGDWHHVIGQIDRENNRIRIYIDGKLDQDVSLTVAGSLTSTNVARIGGPGPFWFNGQVDDLRIYNYALSPAQVRKVMNEGAALRFGP